MKVTFTRTGDRRYRVLAERAGAPVVAIEPAPGFDAYLPHDLVHFLVERHWRLQEGIFGDLSAGGTAGTFLPLEGTRDRRWAKKHGGLATSGRDMDRSEALAAAAFAAWQGHVGTVPAGSQYARDTARAAGVTPEEIAGVLPALDEASARWRTLRVGESMTLELSPAPARAGRREGRMGPV